MLFLLFFFFFFFFNDTATTEIYTLSLHDALPIYQLTAGNAVSHRDEGATEMEVSGDEARPVVDEDRRAAQIQVGDEGDDAAVRRPHGRAPPPGEIDAHVTAPQHAVEHPRPAEPPRHGPRGGPRGRGAPPAPPRRCPQSYEVGAAGAGSRSPRAARGGAGRCVAARRQPALAPRLEGGTPRAR